MTEWIIKTTGLSKRFGPIQAVAGLDLAVPRGSIYGFLGPNGAGKTTTIRLLLGLIRPDAGRIRIFDRELGSGRMQVLSRVGAFVESPSYYPHLTGRENLEVTRRLRDVARAEIARVLDVTRITKAADRPVKGYSLGMRQRLGVAMALMGQPELLLLDEPTNGLDPAGIQEIRELMRDLGRRGEVTVFVSSHLLGEVEQIATQVGIVHEGRLRYQGSPHGLQGQGPVTVIVRVNRMEAALQTLTQDDWRARATPGGEISVEIPREKEAADAAAEVNALLARAGFAVSRLHVTSDSLEDRFLRLTAEETASQS